MLIRYFVGLVFVLALVASPLSAGAQTSQEGTDSEPNLQEPVPSSEPALQLKVDDAGVGVVPPPPRTFDGYTLEQLELRKRRAAFGLIAPAVLTVAGVVPLALGTTGDCYKAIETVDSCKRPFVTGLVLTIAGGTGMIIGSILVGVRTHQLKLAVHDYALEELELRVKRAKIGLYVSAGVLAAGILMGGIAYGSMGDWGETSPDWTDPVAWTGVTLMLGGFVGLITTGPLLHARNRQLRELQEAHYVTPRRVQWDLAQSRLVF